MSNARFLYRTHYTVSRALVIGINVYPKASPLAYAVNDAVAVAQLLKEDLGFPAANITVLTDDAATRDAILKSYLRYTRADIDADERLFVFYVGHGHTVSGTRGEIGFLVPTDADPHDLSTMIRWDELTRNSELVRSKHVLFIMDACYGGLALSRTVAAGSSRFLKDMLLRPARQVLTAGKADETVADAGGPLAGHSVFTGHLIEGLKGKAMTEDGVMTASGLMAYVYGKVSNDRNSRQTPHYGHFDGDGDFILEAPSLADLDRAEDKDLDRLIAVPYANELRTEDDTAAKVARVKRLLASESTAIELHDVLLAEVRKLLAATTDDYFRTQDGFTLEEFLRRLEMYEAAAMDLALLLACTAQWMKSLHVPTIQKVIARSVDRLERQDGLVVWLALRWYPMLLELYCAGIAAVDARRYDALAAVFETPIAVESKRGRTDKFLNAVAGGVLELNRSNILKQIPGHERHHTPLSEYLFKFLQPALDDVFFLGKDYERAFDRFEVLFALCIADQRLQREEGVWAPIGRFGWKRGGHDGGPIAEIIAEGRSQKSDWAPIRGGLFGGNVARFETAAAALEPVLARLGWF